MIAAYCRTSSASQADGNGVASQREAISKWLDGRDAQWFVDEGKTGANQDRPSWKSLMKEVREGKFKIVVVYSLSRASRSITDLSAWTKELVSLGVEIVSIKEKIDPSTATGRFLINILGSVAELEREMIVDRVTDGVRASIKRRGGRWGPASVITAEKRARAVKMKSEGKTRAEVAAALGVCERTVARRCG